MSLLQCAQIYECNIRGVLRKCNSVIARITFITRTFINLGIRWHKPIKTYFGINMLVQFRFPNDIIRCYKYWKCKYKFIIIQDHYYQCQTQITNFFKFISWDFPFLFWQGDYIFSTSNSEIYNQMRKQIWKSLPFISIDDYCKLWKSCLEMSTIVPSFPCRYVCENRNRTTSLHSRLEQTKLHYKVYFHFRDPVVNDGNVNLNELIIYTGSP